MERPELGYLLTRLLRTAMAREEPILANAGLRMWDYAVLSALTENAAPTQAQLAAATGRDKTRLIGNLDQLERLGLVTREPDPADRRNRVVSLTAEGRRILERCRADIREMEDDLLRDVPPGDREAFERVLTRLVDPLD
ncbi:DNA-binding transcriptional regulator, MarR family [Promicromonospora umidemergens]|uniref:MarR family transcriptional regulator n=1 Tax=Promicromonospora umidemergens TaxID=629679 RepID=A0ABP8Y6S8_9MICO|nr:MarR family transcriptional regulator [Promicromonospora umidemergens]MCP2282337.1 DNA-binding transcriptional regulator, MarR family [Promicromonospora umidemergens]